MSSTVVSQIERTISRLSHDEQSWLIEQLANNLRNVESDSVEQAAFESQLAEMATDIEIQSELQELDREFAVTEADGLES